MPGCMAWSGNRRDAGKQFCAIFEGNQFACLLIGGYFFDGGLEVKLGALRSFTLVVFGKPIGGLWFADIDRGIGKYDLVTVCYAAYMVWVQVCKQNRVDLLGPVPCIVQACCQFTECRPERIGGTGINQDQLAIGLDQKGIDGVFYAGCQAVFFEESVAFFGCDV